MNIVGIACVRDEIDIIEAFIRHNLSFVNRLIVLNHGSSDGTREVLEALKAEGLPLDILDDSSPGKQLAKRMTMLMRDHAAGRCGADWVVPLDADEFLTGAPIPQDARTDQPLRVDWLSYTLHESDDLAEANPVIRIQHRLDDRPEQRFHKLFIPGGLAGQAGAGLEQGNHEFQVNGLACPVVPHPDVCLAHFPIRSRGQFITKTVIGHLQNLVMALHDPRWGIHHRMYFELIQGDTPAFANDFAGWLRTHGVYQFSKVASIPDPLVYRGGPLRYTPKVDDAVQSWRPVLNYAQDLARRYGLLKASLTEDQRLSLEQQWDIFTYLRQQLDLREQKTNEWHAQAAHWHAQATHWQVQATQTQVRLDNAELRLAELRQPKWSIRQLVKVLFRAPRSLISRIACAGGL